MVQARHLARASFEREGGDVFILVPAERLRVNGIEEPPVRRHGDEKRVPHVRGAVQRLQRAFFQIEAKSVNATIPARGEGGDKNERFGGKNGHGKQREENGAHEVQTRFTGLFCGSECEHRPLRRSPAMIGGPGERPCRAGPFRAGA